MQKTLEMVETFLKDRPTLLEHNQNPHILLDLLRTEIDELQKALDGHDTPEYVTQEKHVGSELADVLFFVLTLHHILGVDPDEELREKTARNILKYPPQGYQEGSYHKQHRWDRGVWKLLRGDECFYKEE